MAQMISEEDLARARQDPAFRQKFLADNLDRLLEALKRARKVNDSDPKRARNIREGVDLAVKLAERLQRNNDSPGPEAA